MPVAIKPCKKLENLGIKFLARMVYFETLSNFLILTKTQIALYFTLHE